MSLGMSIWPTSSITRWFCFSSGQCSKRNTAPRRSPSWLLQPLSSQGVVHCLLALGSYLCGASGVAFAFIVLASFASAKEGAIPLSAVLVVALFLGNEVYGGMVAVDNVSYLTHVVGGLAGLVAGFALNKMNSASRTM